jgi:hypothetical protein
VIILFVYLRGVIDDAVTVAISADEFACLSVRV